MAATAFYCPHCKTDVAPGAEDRHDWYWLCPQCHGAVTSQSIRYCPRCKENRSAWTFGPSINLADPRPWYLRDPWFCAECSGHTYQGKFNAAVSRVFNTILAVFLAIVAILMAFGCLLSAIQGNFK